MIFRVDHKKDEVFGCEVVRIHRNYNTSYRSKKEPEKVELVDYASDTPEVYGFTPKEISDLKGRSHRLENGSILTADPELYPAESPVKLNWDEWNFLT